MYLREQDAQRSFIAARAYEEIALNTRGIKRYLGAVLTLPLVVAIAVPGPLWAISAALISLAAIVEFLVDRWTTDKLALIEHESSAHLRSFVTLLLMLGACAVGLYTAPNFLLAFAPAPGPIIGFAFSLAGLIMLLTQKSITRAMLALTSPMIGAAIVLNAMAIDGWLGPVLAVTGLALSMIANSRTGAMSITDLIERQRATDADARVLERRVAARTAELHDALVAAEKANNAKTLFLTRMTHELRTPLNAIIGYTEIVEEDLASGESADCPADLARVKNSALHLLGLINDVLDFSKSETGAFPLRDELIDCQALAREVLDMIAPTAASHKNICELIVSPGAETLHGDSQKVRQCLLNLLSNAAKYTHDGRIVLHVRAITLEGAPTLAFEVSDTGVGIAKDVQTRLFQPFVQADNSITRSYDGAGLGLSIARRLAHLMGGEVTLESELGKGARFTLLLPKVRTDSAKPGEAVSAAA